MALAYADVDHTFWPDDISLPTDGLVDWGRVFGHGQITDLYLLALAVAHKGALATFDHRIALNAVVNAEKQHLVLLSRASQTGYCQHPLARPDGGRPEQGDETRPPQLAAEDRVH